MGVLSVIGKTAVAIGKHVFDTGRKAVDLKEEYEEYSDERLEKLRRSTKVEEKLAAETVLAKRRAS